MDEIRVFDSNDENLKILGELLSNETSRKIIKLLIDKEMYTNEIATTLDLRVSLVIHHLKKLEKIGLIEVNKKQIIKKGINHRYFRAVPNVFIAPNDSKEELENKGTLRKIFKDSIKFGSIFFLGLIPILFDIFNNNYSNSNADYDRDLVTTSTFLNSSILIIVGLVIERIISKKRKKN